MELTTYLQILARRKWIIIFTVLATLVGFFIGQRQIPPVYEADTVLRIIPYSSGEPPYAQLIYANRIMNTYVEIATSGPFLDALRQELGLDEGRPGEVNAEIIPDTELIYITVEDSDPYLARDAANALGAMIISENPIRDIKIAIVDPAVTPGPPSQLRSLMTLALVIVVGLVAGTGLAFLFENFDPRLHTTEEIAEIAGLSMIGQIPYYRWRRKNRLLIGEFPYDDAFRRLRINLLKITEEARLVTLMLTSSQPEEGKSTIAANLAISLAQTGRQVLLVDADLHRPTLHKLFNLSNEAGLSSVAQGTLPLSRATQKSEFPGLDILTSGPIISEATELLELGTLNPKLRKLKYHYDLVLVNSPAYLGVVDAALLVSAMDGVLLVAKKGLIRAQTLNATSDQLNNTKTRLLGLIVNNDSAHLPRKYYRYYRNRKPSPIESPAGETEDASLVNATSAVCESPSSQSAADR